MYKTKYLLLFLSIPFPAIHASQIEQTSASFYTISTYLRYIRQDLATELEQRNDGLIKAATFDVLTSYELREDDYMSLDFWRDEHEVHRFKEAIKATIANSSDDKEEISKKSRKFDENVKRNDQIYNNMYKDEKEKKSWVLKKYLFFEGTSLVFPLIFPSNSDESIGNRVINFLSPSISSLVSKVLPLSKIMLPLLNVYWIVDMEEVSERLFQIRKYRKRAYLYRLSFLTSYFILDDIKSKRGFSHMNQSYFFAKTAINAIVLLPRLLGKKFCPQYILREQGFNEEGARTWEKGITSLSLFVMHFSYDQYNNTTNK